MREACRAVAAESHAGARKSRTSAHRGAKPRSESVSSPIAICPSEPRRRPRRRVPRGDRAGTGDRNPHEVLLVRVARSRSVRSVRPTDRADSAATPSPIARRRHPGHRYGEVSRPGLARKRSPALLPGSPKRPGDLSGERRPLSRGARSCASASRAEGVEGDAVAPTSRASDLGKLGGRPWPRRSGRAVIAEHAGRDHVADAPQEIRITAGGRRARRRPAQIDRQHLVPRLVDISMRSRCGDPAW